MTVPLRGDTEMEIHKLLTPYNHNTGKIERIQYIVIHYVEALGGAEANCRYYAGGDRGASAHYFVDFDGSIWQSVEDRDIAWHCGARKYVHPECRNGNSIGIELCVRNIGSMSDTSRDWYFEDATVRSAIELTKRLMERYRIPAGHVLRHYDVTGKICPNPYVFNTTLHTWSQFKAAISRPLTEGWVHDENGWWYREKDGSCPRMCWRLIGNHWYCFGGSGYMLTGWIRWNGKRTGVGDWYYLEESGECQGACWHEIPGNKGAMERWNVA